MVHTLCGTLWYPGSYYCFGRLLQIEPDEMPIKILNISVVLFWKLKTEKSRASSANHLVRSPAKDNAAAAAF